MAIALKSVGTTLNQSVAAATWNVAYPGTVAANDLLVLHISGNGGNFAEPAGWTTIYEEATVINPKGGMWIKLAAGTESGTLAVSVTPDTAGSAAMMSFTGVDTTTPQDAPATNVSLDAGTDTTIDIPAISAVTANTMLVYGCASNSTSITHTAPGTEDKDYAATKAGALYHNPFVGPGSTGVVTITQSAARAYWGAMVILRPAVGAPPVVPSLSKVRSSATLA